MLEGIKILYIEDEDSIRMMTSKILVKRGALLTIACNGEEGLKEAQQNSFDIIISDIQMPVMSGIEMLKNLRSQNIQTPIIIVSAHNETDYLTQLEELKVKFIINKPINLVKLLETIELAVGKKAS